MPVNVYLVGAILVFAGVGIYYWYVNYGPGKSKGGTFAWVAQSDNPATTCPKSSDPTCVKSTYRSSYYTCMDTTTGKPASDPSKCSPSTPPAQPVNVKCPCGSNPPPPPPPNPGEKGQWRTPLGPDGNPIDCGSQAACICHKQAPEVCGCNTSDASVYKSCPQQCLYADGSQAPPEDCTGTVAGTYNVPCVLPCCDSQGKCAVTKMPDANGGCFAADGSSIDCGESGHYALRWACNGKMILPSTTDAELATLTAPCANSSGVPADWRKSPGVSTDPGASCARSCVGYLNTTGVCSSNPGYLGFNSASNNRAHMFSSVSDATQLEAIKPTGTGFKDVYQFRSTSDASKCLGASTSGLGQDDALSMVPCQGSTSRTQWRVIQASGQTSDTNVFYLLDGNGTTVMNRNPGDNNTGTSNAQCGGGNDVNQATQEGEVGNDHPYNWWNFSSMDSTTSNWQTLPLTNSSSLAASTTEAFTFQPLHTNPFDPFCNIYGCA